MWTLGVWHHFVAVKQKVKRNHLSCSIQGPSVLKKKTFRCISSLNKTLAPQHQKFKILLVRFFATPFNRLRQCYPNLEVPKLFPSFILMKIALNHNFQSNVKLSFVPIFLNNLSSFVRFW
jgi:hypothetical protein